MKESGFKKFSKKSDDRICFGHKQFDAIFQNQIKKSQLLFLQQDSPSKIHMQLCRYFIGSAYHMNQKVIVFDHQYNKWNELVPIKLSSKTQKNVQNPQNKIAWRYEQITTQQGCGDEDPNTVDLDLQRNEENVDIQKFINDESLKELFLNICQSYQKSLTSSNDTTPHKIMLCNIFNNSYSRQQISKFLHSLLVFLKSSHCLVLISYEKLDVPEYFQSLVNQYADIAFRIDSLFENDQYDDFDGIIQFSKLPQYHNLQLNRLEQLSFGIVAKSKRKMIIDRLYLSPEDKEDESQVQICGSKQQFTL